MPSNISSSVSPSVASPPSNTLQQRNPKVVQRKPLQAAKNVTPIQRRNKHLELTKHKIDPMERLKNNLSRYTRTNDRRMMIRTLKDCSRLRSIALEAVDITPATPEKWIELEQEV